MSTFISYATGLNSLSGKLQQSSSGLLSSVTNMIRAIPEFVAGVAMFFSSIWVLAIVLLVMGVIYYVWTKGYPRLFSMSHTENVDDLDQEMTEDVSRSLASFALGTPMLNFATAKGPFPEIYTVPKPTVASMLAGLDKYTNFHKTSAAYVELANFLRLNNVPMDENSLLKFFNRALKSRKSTELKERRQFEFVNGWILKHTSYFREAMRVMDKTNLYTFIDYEAYEKGEPLKDRTLLQFGRLATYGGQPLGAIFNLPGTYQDRKLVSKTTKEVADETARAHRRHLQNIIRFKTRMVDAILKAIVVPQKEYADFKASNVVPQTTDHPKTKIFHSLKIFEADINEVQRWFGASMTVPKSQVDTLTGTYYYKIEQLINTKYDTGNGNFMVLEDAVKKELHMSFHDIVAQAQYPHFKEQIDASLFLVLYWYYGHRPSFLKNMMGLSQFYLCFIDLSTYKDYQDHMQPYREWRDLDGSGVWAKFTGTLFPMLWGMYIEEGVINNIRAWLNFPNALNSSRSTWERVRDMLGNHKTFLPEYYTNAPEANESQASPQYVDPDFLRKWIGLETFSDGSTKEPFIGRIISSVTGSVLGSVFGRIIGFLEPFIGPIVNPIRAIMDAVVRLPGMIWTLVESIVFNMIPNTMNLVISLFNFLPQIFSMVLNTIQLLVKILATLHNPMQFVNAIFRLILYVVCAIIITFLKLPFGSNLQLGNIVTAVLTILAQTPLRTGTASRNIGLFAVTVFLGFFSAQLDRLYFDGFLLRSIYNLSLACEDTPNAWYETAGTHKSNKFERKFGLCIRKCAAGYEPTLGGFWCKRSASFIPSYCPQALMMRVYKNKSMPSVYMMDSKVPFSVLGRYTKAQKMKMVEEAMRNKQDYHNTCAASFSQYDHIAKQVCRSMDMVKGSHADKESLEGLCKQLYCRQGQAEPFCYKLNDTQTVRSEGVLGKTNVFKQMLAYATLTSSLMVVLYHLNANDLLTRYP